MHEIEALSQLSAMASSQRPIALAAVMTPDIL